MRQQAAGDAPEAREQAPENRSADPNLVTAEATPEVVAAPEVAAPEPVVPVAPKVRAPAKTKA